MQFKFMQDQELLQAFCLSKGTVDVPSDEPRRSTPSHTTLFSKSCILDLALVSILLGSSSYENGEACGWYWIFLRGPTLKLPI